MDNKKKVSSKNKVIKKKTIDTKLKNKGADKNKVVKKKNTKKEKRKNKKGGDIRQNEILSKIKSIGFEFETDQMTFFKSNLDFYMDEEINNLKKKKRIEPDIDFDIIHNPIKIDIDEIMSVVKDTPVESVTSEVWGFAQKLKTIKNNYKIENRDTTGTLLIYDNTFNRNYESVAHTEFHFTFIKIPSNDNCIIDYLKQSCSILLNYFVNLDEKEVYLKHYDAPQEILNESTLYTDKPDKPHNGYFRTKYYLILNNENINNIKWVIQATIGIDILDMISIGNYLSKLSTLTKSIYYALWRDSVSYAENFINEFLIYHNELNSELSININTISIQILLNYLSILIYYCKFPKMNKYNMTFKIRHSYRTLYMNCIERINDEIIKKSWDNYIINKKYTPLSSDINCDIPISLQTDSVRDDYEIRLIIYLYIFITSDKKIQKYFLYKSKNFTLEDDDDKFKLLNNILLIEFRSFYKFLSYELFKNNEQKVKLDDIINSNSKLV